MGVDKVILRSILSTLAAIILLFAFMLGMLIGLYPSTMMEITYDLGMDSSSIGFAERAYDWSDDEYFMAYAMEVAIGMSDTEKIEVCGEKLIRDEDFASYCAKENERISNDLVDGSFQKYCVDNEVEFPTDVTAMGYEEYVYGQVCVAKYENGNKTGAVELAFENVAEDFPQYNAVVAVLYTALGDNDATTVSQIKGKMEQEQKEKAITG